MQGLGARRGVSFPRYANLGIRTGLPIYQTPHLASTQVPYYHHKSHTNSHIA